MKPPSNTKNLAEIRVTRKQIHEMKHSGGEGWAVSYADLLMVLLSFFTLYFSFSDDGSNSRDSQLAKLAISMRGEKVHSETFNEKSTPEKVDHLASIFKIEGLRIEEHKDRLVIDLEQGVFKSGQFKLQPKLQEQVDIVLEKLIPYQKSILVTIIGHSDSRPMVNKGELLSDNFDLSSARALIVLKYIRSKGFPENKISIRASSSFDRDARSISFEIRPNNEEAGSS